MTYRPPIATTSGAHVSPGSAQSGMRGSASVVTGAQVKPFGDRRVCTFHPSLVA